MHQQMRQFGLLLGFNAFSSLLPVFAVESTKESKDEEALLFFDCEASLLMFGIKFIVFDSVAGRP